MLHWIWKENDGPRVSLPKRDGFVSQMRKDVFTAQVGATVDITFDPDRLRFKVAVPLPTPAAANATDVGPPSGDSGPEGTR